VDRSVKIIRAKKRMTYGFILKGEKHFRFASHDRWPTESFAVLQAKSAIDGLKASGAAINSIEITTHVEHVTDDSRAVVALPIVITEQGTVEATH
jgi:hypothetical protein